MRLLRTDEGGLEIVWAKDSPDTPQYAILSHTWFDDDQEVAFADRDLPLIDLERRQGWTKVVKSKQQAKSDGFEYIWIDTFCIDKSSSTELAEAINSMYRYYEQAQICYAYLSDMPDPVGSHIDLLGSSSEYVFETERDGARNGISQVAVMSGARREFESASQLVSSSDGPTRHSDEVDDIEMGVIREVASRVATRATALRYVGDNHKTFQLDLTKFRKCRWFTRGWTLQELLAPQRMQFFSASWICLPDEVLVEEIAKITRIDAEALDRQNRSPLSTFSIAQRMSWAAGRKTSRPEDRAYSLMGLFEVNFAGLYGEGDRAFARLQDAILKSRNAELSILVFEHSHREEERSDLLATSPDQFRRGYHVIMKDSAMTGSFTLTNRKITFDAVVMYDPNLTRDGTAHNVSLILPCIYKRDQSRLIRLAIMDVGLDKLPESSHKEALNPLITAVRGASQRRNPNVDVRETSDSVGIYFRQVSLLRFQSELQKAQNEKQQTLVLFRIMSNRNGIVSKKDVDVSKWSMVVLQSEGVWNPKNRTLKIVHESEPNVKSVASARMGLIYQERVRAEFEVVIMEDVLRVKFRPDGGWYVPSCLSFSSFRVLRETKVVSSVHGRRLWKTVANEEIPRVDVYLDRFEDGLDLMAGVYLEYLFKLVALIATLLLDAILLALPFGASGYGIYRINRQGESNNSTDSWFQIVLLAASFGVVACFVDCVIFLYFYEHMLQPRRKALRYLMIGR